MESKLTKEILELEYSINRLTAREIGKKLGLHEETIGRALKKHGIATVRRKASHKYNELFFDTWTADMAYILAFITCDGYILDTKFCSYLGVDLQYSDKQILDFIQLNLCPNAKIRERQRLDKRTNKSYHQVNIRIHSRAIIRSLIKYGVVPNKTGKEFLPNIPEEFKWDYLRGIIDGDGYIGFSDVIVGEKIYKKSKLQISSASKIFLTDLNTVFFNSEAKVNDTDSKCYVLTLESRPKIINILSKVYNGNFCLKRKYDKYLEILTYSPQAAN